MAEAGIPVITMGNKVEAGTNYSTLYPDAENMAMVARALGASLGGEGEVALLVGSRGNFVSDTREQAFVDTLKKEYPNIKIVGIEPTNWDAAKATNATQTWLTTYPDLKGIACISDNLCLAADSFVSAMGQPLYAGYDGDDEMGDLLESGKMVIDVLTAPIASAIGTSRSPRGSARARSCPMTSICRPISSPPTPRPRSSKRRMSASTTSP